MRRSIHFSIVQYLPSKYTTQNHSSNPPIARTPSTSRLYSLNSSPTSDTLRSSSAHSINRLFGAGSRREMGDGAREDVGDSKRLGWEGSSSDEDAVYEV